MAIVRGILAVLAGLFVGSLVNMAIVMIGPILIPVPEGVDQTDVEKLKATMHLMQPINFLPPFLAHAMGLSWEHLWRLLWLRDIECDLH